MVIMAVSSAYMDKCVLRLDGMSDVYMLYRMGDIGDPCGTPAEVLRMVERELQIFTWNVRSDRKEAMSLTMAVL